MVREEHLPGWDLVGHTFEGGIGDPDGTLRDAKSGQCHASEERPPGRREVHKWSAPALRLNRLAHNRYDAHVCRSRVEGWLSLLLTVRLLVRRPPMSESAGARRS
jgi:hypothetical protein